MIKLFGAPVKNLMVTGLISAPFCLAGTAAFSSAQEAQEGMEEFNTDWNALPEEFYRDRYRIFVDRRGDHPESYMVTHRLIGYVDAEGPWKVTFQGLSRDLPKPGNTMPRNTESGSIPAHVVVSGSWVKGEKGAASESNILGKDGSFLTDIGASLFIPEAETTQENLAWYGATLVKAGDLVEFETTAPLPVAEMSMGKRYGTDYLMQESKGGGFYLEYHDRPHFHMPQNRQAGGWLTLGKWNSSSEDGSQSTLSISAFSIPFGYAVYTGPDVIHNDGLLTGDYIVVYSVTENFSTVILRNRQDKKPLMVEVLDERPGKN